MRAAVVTRFGAPDVFEITELPDPVPGPGQVAIDVGHAAVGLIDVYIRQGLFKDQKGLPRPPFVPGLEVAGTVRALGEGVTDLRVGEPVVTLSGTGAEGNASGDWGHTVPTNDLWQGSLAMLGFSVGFYLPANPAQGRPAARRAMTAIEQGLVDIRTRTLPLAQAAQAHRQVENGGVHGRILLTP